MARSGYGNASEMKHIVITGATRGIGFGLAQSFLARGCTVAISGREQTNVDKAFDSLKSQFPEQEILGLACDVRQPGQVKNLWDVAKSTWGKIDIWINNAGISGPEALVWQLPPEDVAAVIETNVLGTIYGCQIAIQGMLNQEYGSIYNMEGMGSDGRMHKGLTSYGTSKYATRYLTLALAQELKGTPLIIGSLRPGMVVTDLLTTQYADRPEDFERAKRIFNIIAERVDVVAPWLVDQTLANKESGMTISFTSRWKLIWRFLRSPFYKRDLFGDI